MSTALSRRTMLGLGAALALSALPAFSAHAAPRRPTASPLVPAGKATTLWYPEPADEDLIIEQGLPLGNGRLGALVGGDPASELFHVTDASLWTGGANDALDRDQGTRSSRVRSAGAGAPGARTSHSFHTAPF
ncbi:glycoside hydrolase N-terminal domain-containing protein, partial [Streptomyces sp. NPDC001940]